MNLKEHLFLFDIDGTIIDTGGDGKKALIAALQDSLKITITTDINLRGGIDRFFFSYFYEQCSLPPAQVHDYWESFKAIYTSYMQGLYQNPWQLFPNAYRAIAYLAEHSQIALATGNIKIGAEIKLEKFQLNQFFQCGGYGDNAATRTELVRDALASSVAFYKKKFDKKNIYLFGDTEKDVSSALDNGIIPVLIDEKNLNRDNAKQWRAKYHGKFSNFANFLKYLASNSTETEQVIYF